MNDEELLVRINEVLKPFGCVATELGPDSVGVQGDARVTGPSVYVKFRDNMTQEEVSTISTHITNNVKGITRVLMEITPI